MKQSLIYLYNNYSNKILIKIEKQQKMKIFDL